MANIVNKPIFGGYQQPSFPGGWYQQAGLLGYQQPAGGLLGGGTQNLMQQYLMNLFMRRYQPPAIPQQPGMVGSRMGQGGMQYMAPQVQSQAQPTKQSALTSLFGGQDQDAALLDYLRRQYAYALSGGGGG